MRTFFFRNALVLTASISFIANAQSPAPLTVLTNVKLIDGTGAPAREHVTLVLEGGRIQKVCDDKHPCATSRTGLGADLNGKTVMPGLISAHSHLALLNAESNFDASQYTEPNVVRQLEQYERYGVTTIVSLGMNKDLVYSIRAHQRVGQFDGAMLLTAGRGIGAAGGAPGMAAGNDQIYRPTTPEEARRNVDESAAQHADLIKLWIDNGHGKLPEIPDAVVRAVIEEAHKRHLSVAAHVYTLQDAKRVAKEGVDILAHSVRDRDIDASFISLLKKKHIWYIPTLTVDESFFVFADHPDLLQSPFLQHALPQQTIDRLGSEAYRRATLNDPATAQHRVDFAVASRNLKRLYDAGVQIGFGTDSGAMLGRVPGYSEHRELQLMVAAGLTPQQAIACATAHNAALLHLEDRGILKSGARADLLVVDGDPSHQIADTTHIAAVFHNGIRIQQK